MIRLSETEFCVFSAYISIMYRAFIANQMDIADEYKLKLVIFLKEKCDLDENQAYQFITDTAIIATKYNNESKIQ